MTDAATDDSVTGPVQEPEQQSFQTEARKLLHLMVHSLSRRCAQQAAVRSQ